MGGPGLVPRALHRTTFLPTDISTKLFEWLIREPRSRLVIAPYKEVDYVAHEAQSSGDEG